MKFFFLFCFFDTTVEKLKGEIRVFMNGWLLKYIFIVHSAMAGFLVPMDSVKVDCINDYRENYIERVFLEQYAEIRV